MTVAVARAEARGWPWWLVLLNGIAGIVIGILLITNPAPTVTLLIQFLGIYWLISGIFAIVSIFVDRTAWGWRLFMGILGIVAGLAVLGSPLWSAVLVPATLVWLLGLQGLIVGIMGLVEAFRGAGWGAGIWGVLSIVFGLVLLNNAFAAPLFTALTVAWIGGIFAIVGGILGVIAGFRMR